MADENENLQNVTSVLEKTAIAAADVSLDDVLYLIHGTGSNRDKSMTMRVLRDWVAAHFNNVDVTFEDVTADSVTIPGSGMSTTITEQLFKMLVSASSRDVQLKADEIKFTDDASTYPFIAKFGRAGLSITSENVEILKISASGVITISDGTKTVTVNCCAE